MCMSAKLFTNAQLVTFKQACSILQISRTTLWRRIKDDPRFPRPVKVGGINCPRLHLNALQEYVNAQ